MPFILYALQAFSSEQNAYIRKNAMLGYLSAFSVLEAWQPQGGQALAETATGHHGFSHDQTQSHEHPEAVSTRMREMPKTRQNQPANFSGHRLASMVMMLTM